MPPEIYDQNGNRRDEAWLRQKYGNVQFLDAGAGPKFRLVRVDETEGPAVIKVRLLDPQGQPHIGQPVANHWPDSTLPFLGNSGLKLYRLRHRHGFLHRQSARGRAAHALGAQPIAGQRWAIWCGHAGRHQPCRTTLPDLPGWRGLADSAAPATNTYPATNTTTRSWHGEQRAIDG